MIKGNTTFKEALDFAMLWCTDWEQDELSDEVLGDRVAELVSTKEGARGFFAISLASDCPLMDRLPEALVLKLREKKQLVVDLIVRNLAMSTAMSVEHNRNTDYLKKAGSDRVAMRCIELLKLLDPNEVKIRIEQLLDGIKGKGEDLEFLKKWGYDDEQKLAIASNIYQIANQ